METKLINLTASILSFLICSALLVFSANSKVLHLVSISVAGYDLYIVTSPGSIVFRTEGSAIEGFAYNYRKGSSSIPHEKIPTINKFFPSIFPRFIPVYPGGFQLPIWLLPFGVLIWTLVETSRLARSWGMKQGHR